MNSIASYGTDLEGLSQWCAATEAQRRRAADVRCGARLVQGEGLHVGEAPEARRPAPDRGVLERRHRRCRLSLRMNAAMS